MNDLKEIEITKHSGEEKFRDGSNNLDFNLLSFWQWSSSDVVGVFYLVICQTKLEVVHWFSSYRYNWNLIELE